MQAEFDIYHLNITEEAQGHELERLHPMLCLIFADALGFAARLGWTVTVTSIFRSRLDDQRLGGTRVHCQYPHRAIDIRTAGIRPELVADLERHLKSRWIYDPVRPGLPVAYGAGTGESHGSGPHLHLQAMDLTRRRV